jgi:hypothetical protein
MIEKHRILYCYVCKDCTNHYYIGTQKDENDKPFLDLYNCERCGGEITIFAKGMFPCCSKCGSYNYNTNEGVKDDGVFETQL